MLRNAIAFNIALTLVAGAFSIWTQQLIPMGVRAAGFQAFQKMTDEERDQILKTASEMAIVGISPLIITSAAWIVIACVALSGKKPVNSQSASSL